MVRLVPRPGVDRGGSAIAIGRPLVGGLLRMLMGMVVVGRRSTILRIGGITWWWWWMLSQLLLREMIVVVHPMKILIVLIEGI